jgi:hypothetical protein
MTTLVDLPVMQRPLNSTPAKPPLPREHGAWGILLVPLATAAGISGVFDLKVALLLVSVLCFFVARGSFLRAVAAGVSLRRLGMPSDAPVKGAATSLKWTLLLLAGSAAGAAPLVLVWHRWWLVAFGAAAAPLAFRKTGLHLAAQLAAMTGLTLTAPVTWYVATGNLDPWAWKLWLLNSLYFAGGFFFVKMHLAAAMQRSTAGVARGTIVYHAALAAGLVALVLAGQISWAVALAFVPAVVRAAVGAARLTPKLRIKRLAWTEVALSVVFGLSLIAAARLVR